MRLAALLSGGIDSPVAAYMMSAAGSDVILLHMDNRPYTDDTSIEKVKRIAERLGTVTGKNMPLFAAEHGGSQTSIREKCGKYQCVMCKRAMIFAAKEFALANGCSGIIMGDSLGQVASQTLRNIAAETHGLRFPVIRPLIGLDKLEIEAIGKRIGTYEISILPEPPCGVVPLHPVTDADPKTVAELECGLDFGRMVSRSVASVKIIDGTR